MNHVVRRQGYGKHDIRNSQPDLDLSGLDNLRLLARLACVFHGAGNEAPNPFVELTDRELEVLRLIAAGRRNAGIAGTLVISEKMPKPTSATY